jgi:hypothetical protein
VLTIGFSTTAGVKMGDKTAPVRFWKVLERVENTTVGGALKK